MSPTAKFDRTNHLLDWSSNTTTTKGIQKPTPPPCFHRFMSDTIQLTSYSIQKIKHWRQGLSVVLAALLRAEAQSVLIRTGVCLKSLLTQGRFVPGFFVVTLARKSCLMTSSSTGRLLGGTTSCFSLHGTHNSASGTALNLSTGIGCLQAEAKAVCSMPYPL